MNAHLADAHLTDAHLAARRAMCAVVGGMALALAACDATRDAPAFGLVTEARAATVGGAATAKPTIVLVHGAFADATGWQDLVPLLQRDGYSVIAVQNPLTSLPDDIATTRRVIDAQRGPVVVVGHSYGGAVISGAAAGRTNVKALVYVAAFAPDAGESVASMNAMFPATPLATSVVPDAAGFAYIDTARYRAVFAGDLPERRTRVMAVSQKPAALATLSGGLDGAPAWRSTPTWYVVAQEDHTINPDLERFLARRMGARTTEIRASHLVFVSRPEAVARVVREAAESVWRS